MGGHWFWNPVFMGMTKKKEREELLMPAARLIADFKLPVSR